MVQAAGVITIAHRSGGPLLDILPHQSLGYLCETAEEYAEAIASAFRLDIAERVAMGRNAREWVERFGVEAFAKGVLEVI